ncbi:MAG: hypothetical protein IPI34_04905 [bacterium]|nr:hypothetical protein [bacterium]
MPRRARIWTIVALLLLSAQGAVLVVSGGGAGAPGLRAFGVLALAAAGAAVVALRSGAPRRRALGLAAASALLLGGLWLALPPDAGQDDRWERERQAGLDAELRRVQAVVPRLAVQADSLAAAGVRDFGDGGGPDLAALRKHWRERVPGGDRFPLALAVWRDGERLDWSGELEPFPLDGAVRAVREGRDGWYWRGATAAGDDLLEWQVRLVASDGSGLPPGVDSARLVEAAAPSQAGWQGNARRGLWRVADIALDSTPGDMALTFLRLNYVVPPRAADRSGAAARTMLAILLLWTAAVAGLGRSLAGAAGAVGGLILGRVLWLPAGLVAWMRQAFPGALVDRGPGSLGSLADPTYFATRWGGGLFATAFDALITCALLAAVLAVATAAFRRLARTGGAPRRDRALALLTGGVAVAMLWLLAQLATNLAEGANARLIGPKVPLRQLSFWILHLALLLPSLGLATWMVGAVDALRGRRGAGPAYLAGAVLGAALLAVTGSWRMEGPHLRPGSWRRPPPSWRRWPGGAAAGARRPTTRCVAWPGCCRCSWRWPGITFRWPAATRRARRRGCRPRPTRSSSPSRTGCGSSWRICWLRSRCRPRNCATCPTRTHPTPPRSGATGRRTPSGAKRTSTSCGCPACSNSWTTRAPRSAASPRDSSATRATRSAAVRPGRAGGR